MILRNLLFQRNTAEHPALNPLPPYTFIRRDTSVLRRRMGPISTNS
jgi:hypothetical protein